MVQVSDDLSVIGLKHFKRLMPLLRRLREVGCQRDTAGNRQLFMDDYCAVVFLYLFNPLLHSISKLQNALQLNHVAKALGVKRFSAGSFSESPRVFDPSQLKAIMDELAGELVPLSRDPRLSELKHVLTLVDGTVLRGLCRLADAAAFQTRYNTAKDGSAMHGWRLHTQLDLQTFCPHQMERTGARNSGESRETNVLRRSLEAGRCYVGDGGYADGTLFNDIVAAGSSYVIRIGENRVFQVVEERPLSPQALEGNVRRDVLVRLGSGEAKELVHPVRLVTVKIDPQRRRTRIKQEGHNSKSFRHTQTLVIATNLIDLPAELVALIYRYRYSVELFFRFFKQLLGMRHLLSQRQEGMDIQIYCTVIACMLINIQTGKKPNSMMAFMTGMYLMGVATEQEVLDYLNKPDRRGVKRRAKDALWKKLGV
jgi:hypothetical protein